MDISIVLVLVILGGIFIWVLSKIISKIKEWIEMWKYEKSEEYKDSLKSNEYYEKGKVHFQEGDTDQAIADYSEAILINPRYIVAYKERAEAYSKKGEIDQAIADYSEAIHYSEAVGMNPDYIAAVYIERAEAYNKKGNIDQAIADYSEAIRIVPDYTVAYKNRAEAYSKKGDTVQASSDFAQYQKLIARAVKAFEDYEKLHSS